MANSAITGQVSSLTGGPYVVATSGSVSIKPDEVEQFRVTTTPSAVNYVQVRGSATSGGGNIVESKGSDTNVALNFGSQGTGDFGFFTNGSTTRQFSISHTANAVNYLQFSGNAAGSEPYCDALGSDTDIGMIWRIKGAGSFDVQTDTTTLQFRIAHTASAVNYIQTSGGGTGTDPNFFAKGEANAGMQFWSSGTGGFAFRSGGSLYTQFEIASTASAVNYARISGAVAGSVPYIYFVGSDANVNGRFVTKGTGVMQFQTAGDSGAPEQFRIYHTASAVNYWAFTGSAAGGNLSCTFTGSSTDIGAVVAVKGAGRFFINGASTGDGLFTVQNSHATTPHGIRVDFTGGSPDNNTVWLYAGVDSTTTRAICYSDGDWYNHDNTYGAISDPRVKRNVTPVNSQWNDVKQIASGMINYETKWKPGRRMLGVDADVVEQISPGVVHMVRWGDEDLKAVDTMTMLQKGFKALGEALERIEALEAKAK